MDIIASLTQLVKSNPFLSGGLAVGLVSFATNSLRDLPHKLITKIEDFLFMSVQVNVGSDLYRRVEQYLAICRIPIKHGIAWLTTEDLDNENVSSSRSETDWDRHYQAVAKAKKKKQYVKITTYDGPIKSFLFKTAWIRIKKERPKDEGAHSTGVVGALLATTKPEHYLFQFLTFDKKLPKHFLETVVEATHINKDNLVPIYLNDENSWIWLFDLPKRTMESVITDNRLHLNLLTHLQEFLKNKNWYLSLGIPYHFGCLLYGPPGNGKTSILHALASSLDLAIYFMDMSLVKDNTTLIKLLSKLEEPGIIVFEDIDTAFLTKNDDKHKLTFSGLLNSLDGLKSTPGMIVAFTTNHLEKLDQALIRAGRIDFLYHIDNASKEQSKQLFLKFYGAEFEKHSKSFAAGLPDKHLNMATIQGYLLQYRTPEEAILNMSDLDLPKKAQH